MAKEDNLRPIRLSHDEATKNGRKGGLASAEARRRRKEMREFLNDYLNQEAVPHLKDWMRSHGVEEEDCCNLMALILAVFSKAMTGDLKAADTILGWAGLLPLQQEREAAEMAYYHRMTDQEGESQPLPDKDSSFGDVVIYDPATGIPAK